VLIKQLFLALPALALAGCVTTSMQGYADNAPPNHPVTRIAAMVAAPPGLRSDIQRSLTEAATNHGVAAIDALSILPPTRTYSDAEVRAQLKARGMDAVLLLTVGDSGIQREYAGTIFQGQSFGTYSGQGTVNTFGNTSNVALSGTYSGSSFGTATPVHRYSRTTQFTAKLLDAETGRTLWVGGGQVNAGGLLFVGNGTSAASSTSAIFDDLAAKGLIAHTS
jgi:hypothetical protein